MLTKMFYHKAQFCLKIFRRTTRRFYKSRRYTSRNPNFLFGSLPASFPMPQPLSPRFSLVPRLLTASLYAFVAFSFWACVSTSSAIFSHSACFVQSLCRRRLRRQRHQRFAFVVCIFLAVFHLLFPSRFARSFVLLRWISTCRAGGRGGGWWGGSLRLCEWVSVSASAELQIEVCTLLHFLAPARLHFLTGWLGPIPIAAKSLQSAVSSLHSALRSP